MLLRLSFPSGWSGPRSRTSAASTLSSTTPAIRGTTVIQKTTDEQFQAMLDIHLVAPFRILRAASTYIREAAKTEIAAGQRVMRKVVNITSIAGTDGNAGQAGYSSGKAGVIGLTKTMAKEWGRYNVNVNAVVLASSRLG